jgi:hypothetical protein
MVFLHPHDTSVPSQNHIAWLSPRDVLFSKTLPSLKLPSPRLAALRGVHHIPTLAVTFIFNSKDGSQCPFAKNLSWSEFCRRCKIAVEAVRDRSSSETRVLLSPTLVGRHTGRSAHTRRSHTGRWELHTARRRASRTSWWRESRRHALWKSRHTYQICQSSCHFRERMRATHTRREAGHARRWLETWWQALWERRHACRGSVFKARVSYIYPHIRTSRESRRHTTRRHRESGWKTSRRHHASGRSKPRRRGIQHRVVRRLSLSRV